MLSSLILAIGILIYLVLNIKELFQGSFCKKLLSFIISAICCLGLTAWFVLPMLEQLLTQRFYVNSPEVKSGKYALQNTVLLPLHLFFRNRWLEVIYRLFNFTPRYGEQITWTLPSNFWGDVAILGIVLIVSLKNYRLNRNRDCLIYCVGGAICIAVSYSQTIAKISFLSVFQFVWRIMLLLPIMVSFALAASINDNVSNHVRIKKISFVLSIICLCGFYLQLLNSTMPKVIAQIDYADTIGKTNVAQGEYLPASFPSVTYGCDNVDELLGDGKVTLMGYDKQGYHF
jgi:hypothetical protein